MTTVKIYISSNLKYLGQSIGIYSQTDRALYLEVPLKRYQAWENRRARPPYEYIKEISMAYNVTVEELLYKDLQKKKSAVEEY